MIDRLGAWLAVERERWALWLPVALGAGVALFFALPVDPPPLVALVVFIPAAGAAYAMRGRAAWLALALGVAAFALGFGAAERRTQGVAGPMLTRPLGPVPLTGRVVGAEGSGRNARLTLDEIKIDARGGAATPVGAPTKIRLRFNSDGARPPVGAVVSLRARLLPSSPPAAPGAYDFQRHAYFDGIGAVGFVAGPVEVIAPPPSRFAGGVGLEMERWRETIAERVAATLSGPAAGIAGALLHGEQSFVPPEAMQAMRDSGLAHLLSISGLHIGLVAGIVMYVVRALLALTPYVALRWPCKKIAAVAGLAAAAAYTLLIGPSAPTVRSVLMTGLALAAIMIDRNPFSMRLVGFAAVVVLLFAPESLTGPSFQMSFAAVAALIAVYEMISEPLARWKAGVGPVWRAGLYMASLALTSVVAGLATAPFSVHHFQNVAAYGVLANMIAVPLTGVWIMPLTLIIYLLMPFGWEEPALIAFGWGVEAILRIAEWTAALPGAVIATPAMPATGLALTVVGGLWLSVWRTRPRWWGAPLVIAGLISPIFAERPDVLISSDGRLTAVRLNDGGLALSSARTERFIAETWLRRDGRSRGEIAAGGSVWPLRGSSPDGALSCDEEACLYRRHGQTLSFARRPGGAAEDCGKVDGVIAPFQVGRRCKAGLVIDEFVLRRDGATALYVRENGTETRTVNGGRGERPWTGGKRVSSPTPDR